MKTYGKEIVRRKSPRNAVEEKAMILVVIGKWNIKTKVLKENMEAKANRVVTGKWHLNLIKKSERFVGGFKILTFFNIIILFRASQQQSPLEGLIALNLLKHHESDK